jgi:hypothetical protein
MLKLPFCPYCKTHFLYFQIKNSKKIIICPHCGKKMIRAGKWKKALLFLFTFLFFTALDFFLLRFFSISLFYLISITFTGVAAVQFLIPYTITFKPFLKTKI